MKSLNRTLSLVLVLVMVLGLVGISAGASFKDEAKINYKEAVGVMTGIGALVGYPDGTFNGAGTVTREEAVKTVVYAVLGADVAKNLAGTATGFADVDAGRWSAGVIAYAVSRGIVNGRDAKTFDPTGNVTANEVGKMMLCAAGYGAKGEFIGSSWELNTAVLANKTGIFDGSKATSHSTPATREETALYTFNGITGATVMEYNKVFDSYIPAGTGIGGGDGKTIAQTVYPTLVKSTTTDALGRPATSWTYNGKEIGKYEAPAAYVYTKDMNTAAGQAELTKTFKGFTVLDTDASTVGVQNKIDTNGKVGSTDLAATTLVSQIAGLTGNGVTVAVYVTPNKITEIAKVAVIKNDITVVAAVDAARKSVTLTTKNTPVSGSATYAIKDGDTFYPVVKDLKVGDYVLVTPTFVTGTTYGVANAVLPKQVKGLIGATNSLTNTVYLNGTTPYVKSSVATSAVAGIAVDTKNEATLWLDANGFIVHSKTATVANKHFVYVLDRYTTLVSSKIVEMAKVVYADGTIADIAVATKPAADGLYQVSSVANDVYTLAASDKDIAASKPDTAEVNKHVALLAGAAINAYDKMLTQASQVSTDTNYFSNFYASDVKFIYVNSATKTATVKTGVQGVASLPTTSYALVEALSAADATPVVTAVILVDGVAATVDSENLVYFGSTNPNDGSASPVGSIALMNKTTNKYENFKVHAGFINGAAVANGVPTNSISHSGAYAGTGFYSYAKADDTGAYVLAPYALNTGKTAIQHMKSVSSTFDDKLITVNGVLIDISTAKFGDVRSEAAQAAQPVILNAAGICAVAKNNINLSVVYDATTGKASIVYINSLGTGFKIGTQSSGVTFATGTIANAAADLSAGTAVVLGTTKIPAGTTVYVMAATNDNKPVNANLVLTQVTADAVAQKGIYSFVMPSADIAANAFTEANT